MGFAFNPFTGNFDQKGSGGGGGGSAFFAGEVATYTDLPLDGSAALDSRWLVRSNSGTWPFSSYKQAGVYVRKAIVGSSRDNDYQLTDTSFFDVMSDSAFLIYDDADATKNLKFQLSGISASTTRTLTAPDASGKIALQSEAYDFYYATAPSGATGGSGSVWVWNIPSWSTMQVITMIGAGGGGGSGRVGASGAVCGGGGAGGGGSYGTFITRITGGDQIEVLVGAGGAGGAAVGTATSNGLSGTTGGDTYVKWVTPNITLRTSSGFGAGVNGGGGGNNAIGTSGAGGTGVTGSILGSGGNGGAGNAGSLTGNAGGGGNSNSTQGGRAGGSIDATPTAFNGGANSGSSFTDVRESFLLPNLSPKIGTAAAGGNASITGNGAAGGNAGGLGGGGSGGGAALSGFLSGAGGNGGNGFVRINCF
jgi:hypothetical protein